MRSVYYMQINLFYGTSVLDPRDSKQYFRIASTIALLTLNVTYELSMIFVRFFIGRRTVQVKDRDLCLLRSFI